MSAGLMTVSPGEPALGFVGGRLMSFDGTRVRAISSRQMVTGTIAGSKPVPHSTGNQPGATYEVVFPEPFISVPRVMVQVDNSARLTVAPNTVTSSGFRISVDNRSGVNVPAGSYSLSYQALE
ncbi:MAG: hypothetical protein Q3999_08465 [Buchananella hordeovulneris]|nr:hypothetical protein [Buchananella hordeovulneris]